MGILTVQQGQRRSPGAWLGRAALVLGVLGLLGCGGGRSSDPGTPMSAGQMAPPSAASKVTHYAASRFAEHASFGPTPALIAELRAKGFEAWIDEQFALPFVPMDIKPAEALYAYTDRLDVPRAIWSYPEREFMRLALVAPDQLRLRVTWSLSQVIVATKAAGRPPGEVNWVNLLYRHAFSQYGPLLRDTSTNRLMGWYLNNDQNRPKSAECTHCAPNENYARELLQLFSIGVVQLNPDGTSVRDGRGRLVESYTQTDVEELARALTGWTPDRDPPNTPDLASRNWIKPMVPSTWPPERDAGRKVVLGRVFPAGQSQNKDLDDIVAMLMAHPNIAPFVSLRLIQHLVKSDPTPAYVGRVAARFRNNGSGVAGDMKAVVKAVLLDAEARAGDVPEQSRITDGKFREPVLHRMAMFRGMQCRSTFQRGPDDFWNVYSQPPFAQDSVFSFYTPFDRAPGSNLLAPEQRLVDASELTGRLNQANDLRYNRIARTNDLKPLTDAGCQVQPFIDAYTRSPKDYLDLLSSRYFRGAMPPTLRSNLEQMIQQPNWRGDDASEGAMRMLDLALATPYFGVIH